MSEGMPADLEVRLLRVVINKIMQNVAEAGVQHGADPKVNEALLEVVEACIPLLDVVPTFEGVATASREHVAGMRGEIND